MIYITRLVRKTDTNIKTDNVLLEALDSCHTARFVIREPLEAVNFLELRDLVRECHKHLLLQMRVRAPAEAPHAQYNT